MAKVQKLSEVPNGRNEALIDMLEGLLAEAKSGELLGVAYIGQWKGDMVSSSWSLVEMNARRMIGEIEFMKRDMMEPLD